MKVDLKKITGLENLMPTPTTGAKSPVGNVGPSFQDTLNGLGSLQGPGNKQVTSQGAAQIAAKDGIKFSNHAIDRMRTRGITFSPEDVSRLSEAVGKAAAKGSKDSLILMNDSALIVSVKNNTVVTVMDKNALKENVFTNIDSTIVM